MGKKKKKCGLQKLFVDKRCMALLVHCMSEGHHVNGRNACAKLLE